MQYMCILHTYILLQCLHLFKIYIYVIHTYIHTYITGCQKDSGINLSMPAFSTTSSTSSSSSSSSSSNPPLPSNAVNISTTSITPTATSSSNPNPNPTSSSSSNNNSSSKIDSDGDIIDVKLFWELARYWLRGIDRPNLGDVATESELMDQVWEYKDILLREQIQDAVISVLGKRKRS